jgi:hypothetical protein
MAEAPHTIGTQRGQLEGEKVVKSYKFIASLEDNTG